MKTVNIQFLSNLYIRHQSLSTLQNLVKPSAPCLALLGNIGQAGCPRTEEFIRWANSQFDTVFWVPGALEYSSPKNESVTWRDRADQIYQDLESWNATRTIFCQKMDYTIPDTNLRVFASPFWGNFFNPHARHRILDWNGNSQQIRMNNNHFTDLQYDEITWLLGKIYRLEKGQTSIVLSHSPIPHLIMSPYNVFCHLYGTEQDASDRVISGGKDPWVGLNMVGSPHYRKNAIITLRI
jgi:hypothetical protein